MMNGEVLTDGWKSEAVKDALDLCLACKGCKGDCPVNVDMATYKAEFLSHYYEGRLRPRHAYAMGWIYWWARLASLAPDAGQLLQPDARPARRRQVARRHRPAAARCRAFARETFKEWFRRRPVRNAGQAAGASSGPTPSTTTSTPRSARRPSRCWRPPATRCGCRPRRCAAAGRCTTSACSTTAKSLLREILTTLRPQIQAGVPVVGLEPSCVAVFRDELTNLFPDDEDAKRLHDQTFLLSEFLNKKVEGLPAAAARPQGDRPRPLPPQVDHGHGRREGAARRSWASTSRCRSGCCGMAGSFGFERGNHYDVSHRRAASARCCRRCARPATTRSIIADGFSCQQQIGQTTAAARCTWRRSCRWHCIAKRAGRGATVGGAAAANGHASADGRAGAVARGRRGPGAGRLARSGI